MLAVFSWFAEHDARRVLAHLMDQIGAAGLAAAAASPAVSAAVDQHCAAVRDILILGVEGSASTAGVVLLSGYAKGVLDQAGVDTAAVATAVGGQWHRAGWLALRLVAVCALSRSEGWGHSGRWAAARPPSGPPSGFGAGG